MRNHKETPYFYAKKSNGQFIVKGNKSQTLGCPLSDGKEGVFVKWHWDGQKLIVENDKFGMYPLYYYCQSDEICVSPSITQILACCPNQKVDHSSLSVFLRLGLFLKEDTPFKAIKQVLPQASFRWENGQLSYEGKKEVFKPLKISEDEAMQVVVDLLQKAIKKCLAITDDFYMPISGGRDSRHILFQLERLGVMPRACVTHEHYPTRNNADMEIAEILVKEMGLKHIKLPQGPSRFDCEKRKNLDTSFCSDEHSQTYCMSDYFRGNVNAFYDGIGGMLVENNLLADEDLDLYAKQKYEDLAVLLFNRLGPYEDMLKRILSPKAYKLFSYDEAISTMAEELTQYSASPNPINYFHFYNRIRREINQIPYGIFSHVEKVFSPYLDDEFCEFLLSLPLEMVVCRDFHSRLIARYYPKYKHIPYGVTKGKVETPIRHLGELTRSIGKHYMGKMKFTSRYLDMPFLLPRLYRSAISQKYAETLHWLPMTHVLYLTQLEDYINE